MKLIAKDRIASKTIKRYDAPKTPYQRVIESPHVPDAIKDALSAQVASLNPFQLRRVIEQNLKRIMDTIRS